jgi:hypothetical protein
MIKEQFVVELAVEAFAVEAASSEKARSQVGLFHLIFWLTSRPNFDILYLLVGIESPEPTSWQGLGLSQHCSKGFLPVN